MSFSTKTFFYILFIFLSLRSAKATTYFVNGNLSIGLNHGKDWNNAFFNLQDALSASNKGDSIWVAKGTYKPTFGTDRSISFQIPDSVKLFGGFDGNEPFGYNLEDRDLSINETILSGDIGILGNNQDNTHHIIFTQSVSIQTSLDGFIITGGNANGGNYDSSGGGWLNVSSGRENNSSPSLTNLTFKENIGFSGGAIYNYAIYGGDASPILFNVSFINNIVSYNGAAIWNHAFDSTCKPTIKNCTFSNNSSGSQGGAILNEGVFGNSSPKITNCAFLNNTGKSGGAIKNLGTYGTSSPLIANCSFIGNNGSQYGGAIMNSGQVGNSNPNIVNCSFFNNSTQLYGGAIYNDGYSNGRCEPIISNCNFVKNSASSGGGIYTYGNHYSSTPVITNCIFSKNTGYRKSIYNVKAITRVSYSLFDEEGCGSLASYCGNGMIFSENPGFVDLENGDLKLQSNSIAIDHGTYLGITHTSDITGQNHINSPDLGAFEYPCSKVLQIQSVVTISNEISSQVAIETLEAENLIDSSSNVYFQAGKFIILKEGFNVKSGNVFKAVIDNECN